MVILQTSLCVERSATEFQPQQELNTCLQLLSLFDRVKQIVPGKNRFKLHPKQIIGNRCMPIIYINKYNIVIFFMITNSQL